MKKGYFITFEGPDGSGKTTILNRIIIELKNNGIIVKKTREPGGEDSICESIRQLVLNGSKTMNIYTEALLFAASRSQHVNEYIIPIIKIGTSIISDRFLDSSIAYQGFGREIGYEKIENINKFGIKDFKPDFTFFFEVSPQIANKRIFKNPNREKNRFDLEDLEIQTKVYNGYHKIIEKEPNRFIIIDAKQPIEQVFDQVWSEIKNIYGI